MRKLLFPLLLAITTQASADESWLNIIKSEKGFLFVGPMEEKKFSFDIIGQSIRTTEDRGRVFAEIDGIIVQIMTYPTEDLPKGDALAQHKKYETDYQETTVGATVTSPNNCSMLVVPHREWTATLPGASTSQFLTVELQKSILVLVVAYNDPNQSAAAQLKFTSICSSLTA